MRDFLKIDKTKAKKKNHNRSASGEQQKLQSNKFNYLATEVPGATVCVLLHLSPPPAGSFTLLLPSAPRARMTVLRPLGRLGTTREIAVIAAFPSP